MAVRPGQKIVWHSEYGTVGGPFVRFVVVRKDGTFHALKQRRSLGKPWRTEDEIRRFDGPFHAISAALDMARTFNHELVHDL